MLKEVLIFLIVLKNVCSLSTNDSDNINPTECGQRPNDVSKIVGGVRTDKGDWPWQVALYYNGRFICGGSLINSQWVITASHCVNSKVASYFEVKIGYWNRLSPETWSEIRNVSKLIQHDSYSSSTMYNDIALLKLDNSITYGKYVGPICIPDKNYNIPTGNVVYATGWGRLSDTSSITTFYLMQVNMDVISETDCNDANRNRVNYNTQICAGVKGENKDTCQGDSGGPLVVQDETSKKWYLGGITSYGYGCSGAGVYTRTSAFNSWIKDKLVNASGHSFSETMFRMFIKLISTFIIVILCK